MICWRRSTIGSPRGLIPLTSARPRPCSRRLPKEGLIMRCPRCDCENRAGAKFCNECAAPLPLHCYACGAENRPGANFCDACGTSLSTPSAASRRQRPNDVTLAAQAQAPIAYTPVHLTEKIRHATATLTGERKQVTVLFADLKGSMELLADRDPEEARQLLDPVLERLM